MEASGLFVQGRHNCQLLKSLSLAFISSCCTLDASGGFIHCYFTVTFLILFVLLLNVL